MTYPCNCKEGEEKVTFFDKGQIGINGNMDVSMKRWQILAQLVEILM
jgi:hypothetical protein